VKHTRAFSIAALAVVAMAAAGCGGSGSSAEITLANDRVGPLRINQSDRAHVVALAGKPMSEFHGQLYRGLGLPRVDELDYGCHRGRKSPAGPLRSDDCTTTFWLDARTGKLVDFLTRDPRYATAGGVHVGTSTTAAEQATHKTAGGGCGGPSLPLGHRIAFSGLVLWIVGSHSGPKARVIGGHIDSIWLVGNDTGMELQC
jgi:hypothetical protein